MTDDPTSTGRSPRRRARFAVAALVACVLATGALLSIVLARPTAPAEPTTKSATTAELKKTMATLRPLHKTLGKPKAGDWLARYKEPGQTFDEYRQCDPALPRGKRRVLYVQPLGDFNDTQRKIITLTAQYMGLYFNLPVKVNAEIWRASVCCFAV